MVLLDLSGIDSRKVLATLDEPCSGTPRKRRRLDDLTAEERVLRRKLKNRVAAQTARDRKKARMSELEDIVLEIEKENDLLKVSNEELMEKLQMVAEENTSLKERLGMSPPLSSSDHEYAAPCPSSSSQSTQRTDTDINTDQLVIKKEEASPEYASFRNITQQQQWQILLLSLITIWLHSLSLKKSSSMSLKVAVQKKRWMRSLLQYLLKLKSLKVILRMLCLPSLKAHPIPQILESTETRWKTLQSSETMEAWWATRPLMKF